MGLLDHILDPEFLARSAERTALAKRIANHFGYSIEQARTALDEADQQAFEMFAVGNTIPFEARH